jgi:tetratricopeptide (TPR) repeat protein
MERKMACLRRTRIELSATTDVLVGADAGVARRAGGLVGDLPDPTRCLDLRTLDAGTDAPAPVEAAGVEGIRVILARARAQRRAGRYEAALRLVEEARVHLPEVTFAGIDAEVAAEEGVTLQALDRHEEARVAHRAALFESLGRRDRKTVQLAASELMVLEGFLSTEAGAGTAYRRLARGVSNGDPLRDAVSAHSEAVMLRLQDRHDESLAAGARALALLERSDRAGDAALTVRFRAQRGQTLRRLSRPGEAQDEFRRAIADARAEFGDDHPDVGRLQIELAMLLQQRHRYPEAEELFVAGLSRLDARYAENTPLVAAAHSAFAGLLRADGRAAQAEATHRAAIASLLEVVGEDHPFVAQSRVGLALALRDQGRTREAETQLREGIDGLTTVLGADHPRVTSATNNLGNLLRADGRAAEAVAVHRQALALRRARSGPTSLPVSQSRYNLGFALRDAGDHQGARDEHAAALAIRLDDPSPDEAAIVDVRLALAEDELRLGHADAAWEQAAAVWRAHETDDEDLRWALMAWVYARALWETQPEARPEARALVQRAAATYRAAGQPTPDIDAWLQRH